MIRALVLNVWFYGFIGLSVGTLLGFAGRWLLRRRDTPHVGILNVQRSTFSVQRSDVGLALVSGAGFVALWLRWGPSVQTVIISMYFSIFLLIFVLDVTHRWVPNTLLLLAAMLALTVSVVTGHPPLLRTLLGGMIGFVWFYLVAVAYRDALGAGDVKLAGLIGLMTGFPGVLMALTIGILVGGGVAALLLISGLQTRKSYIPYAPFLVSGALLTLVFGTQTPSRLASFL